MSSPATANFLRAWRNVTNRRPVTLAKIQLVSPSAQTLYVASTEIITPDGQVWELGLKAGSIHATVEMLGPGPNPCDATIYLANRRYAFQSSGKIDAALSAYQWQGALVTLYFWEQSLTNIADLFQVFEGAIDGYQLDDTWLTLNLLQPRTWNKPCPPTVIDKATYPNAPNATQGLPLPIVYGDWRALPMRSPHTSSYGTTQNRREEAGGGSGVVPFTLVDPGTGAAGIPKFVVAGHAMSTVMDRTAGCSFFFNGNAILCPLDTAGLTATSAAGESYITINDDTLVAYYGIVGADVRAAANSALNPRNAADAFDETSFATLDQGAGQNVLELTLPNLASLGYIVALDVDVCFIGNAANANNIQVYPYNPNTGVAGTVVAAVSTPTTPTMIAGTWDAAWVDGNNWHFGGFASAAPDRTTVDMRINFTGGAANKASILWAAIRVKFRPTNSLVTPARVENWGVVGGALGGLKWGGKIIPAQFNPGFDFFGNVKGYVDDGGGTYTGAAGSLIEQPPDIARHFLATYGAQTQFETGASTFGSFVVARNALRNVTANFFKMAGRIGDLSSVQPILQSICSQALSCCLFDRFTSKWLFHVWRQGAQQDYDWTFDRTDCPDLFEVGVTSDVNLRQGVRIQYGYDHFKHRTLFESFVTAAGSSQGYTLPTVRDQILTVATGVNDKLDFALRDLATTYHNSTVTLTAGTYAPIDLAAEIRGKMRAVFANIDVGWGFSVKAGFNDKLDFYDGAGNFTATLAAGDYTADALAVETARALNAAGSALTFTCAYSIAAGFTITPSAATFRPLPYSGANHATMAWPVLGGGYRDYTAGVASWQSDARDPRADRFYIHLTSYNYAGLTWVTRDSIKLMFNTGASVATCCANLLGWTTAADLVAGAAAGNTGTFSATYARSNRETLAATSQSLYGPKSDTVIVADWIRDEFAAQQLRDRHFDFGSVPRTWVKFRTHRAPDMQRMRVIGFTNDMDARRPYVKYGSDGSWAGKTFRVTEVDVDLGPSYHTEIMAMEA